MLTTSGLVPDDWKRRFGWNKLTEARRDAIGEYGIYMFGLASPKVADVEDIKYDGRLVVLDDGSRWEVDNRRRRRQRLVDVRQVALYDVMDCLDDADHANVNEEC